MMLLKRPAFARPKPDVNDPDLKRLLGEIAGVLPGVYLVGGGLRDLLTGHRPGDLDLVVPGDAHTAAETLAAALGAHVFALDEARGQYRLTVLEDAFVRDMDVSSFGGDLGADLTRRDFTINAMAAPIDASGGLGALIDPTGGHADLDAKRVRMVSEQALVDDPLRLLRAVRFAVQLGFEIEAATSDAARGHAALLGAAAAERQRDELVRILSTSQAAVGVRLTDALGLLDVLIPELAPARGVGQPGQHHYWDVFDHSVETLAALDRMLAEEPPAGDWLARDFQAGLAWYPLRDYLDGRCGGERRAVLLKLAGLLHDIAKPETKTIEADGRVRFFGHPEIGAGTAKRICERLRFGNHETNFVSLLVEEHLRPTQLASGDLPSHRAVHRFFRDLGEAAPACLFLCLADGAGAAGPRMQRERWQGHVAYMSYVLEQGEAQAAIAAAPRLITGRELMAALDLEPGPLVGRLMAAVEEAVATGEISTGEEALACARRLLEEKPETAEEPLR